MSEKVVLDKGQMDDWICTVNRTIDDFTSHPFGGGEVGEVLDAGVKGRGKLLRPKLLILSSFFGDRHEENRERICRLAAIVELIHTASLIHDDIVDDAPSRRGRPSVQGAYGKSAAVYAGDFLMSRVCYYVAKENFNRAGEILAKTVEEMCAGEIRQSRLRYREDVSPENYLENIHGKTAALFMAACRIGAEEGGCGEKTVKALTEAAECLGMMFQLRDDLLDVVSDEKTQGKAVHRDFLEGIYTYPVLWAMRQEKKKGELASLLAANAKGRLTEEDLGRLGTILEESGGIRETRREIKRLQARAERILTAKLPRIKPAEEFTALVRKLGKDG